MNQKERFERVKGNNYKSGTDRVYPLKSDSVMPCQSIERNTLNKAVDEFFASGKKTTVIKAEDLSKMEVAIANPFRKTKPIGRPFKEFKSKK